MKSRIRIYIKWQGSAAPSCGPCKIVEKDKWTDIGSKLFLENRFNTKTHVSVKETEKKNKQYHFTRQRIENNVVHKTGSL